MSHTVSPEQPAANRANAANSTGPRTPEGKLRSAQNARKHGFTASSFAVGVPSGPVEDLNEVANLREDMVNLYHPVNSQELFAVERIALAQQAILRAARLEAGFFSLCLGESFDEFERLKALRGELRNEPNSPRRPRSPAGPARFGFRSAPLSERARLTGYDLCQRSRSLDAAGTSKHGTNGSAGPQWRRIYDFRHHQPVENVNMFRPYCPHLDVEFNRI